MKAQSMARYTPMIKATLSYFFVKGADLIYLRRTLDFFAYPARSCSFYRFTFYLPALYFACPVLPSDLILPSVFAAKRVAILSAIFTISSRSSNSRLSSSWVYSPKANSSGSRCGSFVALVWPLSGDVYPYAAWSFPTSSASSSLD